MDDRRYFGLDALRGGMMMLGILLHAAMFYLAFLPPTVPLPVARNNAYVFNLVFDFIHSFRMPTFFVLAGFFAALLVARRGLGSTWANRAARILAPLAVSIVVILPVTMVLTLDVILSVKYGTHDLIPNGKDLLRLDREMRARGFPPGQVPLAHLWFLYYLCYFYLLIPLCRLLVQVSLRFEAQLRRWLASSFALPLLALVTAATLWPYRGGQVLEGYMFLKPHLPSLVYYGFFFALGYALHHYRGFLQVLARDVLRWIAAAAILFPLSLVASHYDYAARGASFALHLAAVLANAFCTWALIYAFIGAALRWFDRDSPWIVYVSQSSYWVFLVHMPLVTLAVWWLVPYDLYSPLKFLLVCAFTSVIAFATFHYGVQKSWLGVFLHGRRFALDWPWREAAARKLAVPAASSPG